jgi:DNA-binding response OmpR family regulator
MTEHKERESSSSDVSTAVKTILIVEDDRGIGQFFFEAIKQETPYQALLATDGYQALKLVREVKPSLFLLDYGLPRMTGLELYDRLHATEELEDIPALMISAQCPWAEVKRREIRCMTKPIELDDFLQTIDSLIIH